MPLQTVRPSVFLQIGVQYKGLNADSVQAGHSIALNRPNWPYESGGIF